MNDKPSPPSNTAPDSGGMPEDSLITALRREASFHGANGMGMSLKTLLLKAAYALSLESREKQRGELGECDECGTPYSYDPTDGGTICVRCLKEKLTSLREKRGGMEKDAQRYRKLKAAITVPNAMQSFIRYVGWHPDTFKMGIDEAIDAAASRDEKNET